jgi:hypothetical protein
MEVGPKAGELLKAGFVVADTDGECACDDFVSREFALAVARFFSR